MASVRLDSGSFMGQARRETMRHHMTYRARVVTRRVVRASICAVVILLPRAAGAQQSGSEAANHAVPIDRWLVSSAFPTDGGTGDSPLTGPGEEGVLPDRGREQAGSGWQLVRRDGRGDVRLDSLFPERDSPVFVYAHSYVRLPADQTMLLSWSGLGDTGVRTWVNGRLLRDHGGEPIVAQGDVTVPVRLGGGWNTLLFQSAEAGGEFGFAAALAPSDGDTPIRVQASRPPGDIRTGPAPWVLAHPTLRPTGGVAWSKDELSGELMLEVTAWSRTPIDTVEVRLRADGADARGGARWLTPGTPAVVSLWLPFEQLERARRSTDEVEVELKWFDEEVKQRIPGPTETEVASSEIRASGSPVGRSNRFRRIQGRRGSGLRDRFRMTRDGCCPASGRCRRNWRDGACSCAPTARPGTTGWMTARSAIPMWFRCAQTVARARRSRSWPAPVGRGNPSR